MFRLKSENDKQILLRNPEACRLVKRRAIAERRSIENALTLTIEEALQERYGSFRESYSTKPAHAEQEKSVSDIPGGPDQAKIGA
jgi:hypothetical protein